MSSILAHTRNILVIRLDEIGDFVLTSPFLRELRRNAPDAGISLVVKEGVEPLARNCPYIDQLFVFRRDVPGYLPGLRRQVRAYAYGRRNLRGEAFDLALLPRCGNDSDGSKIMSYASGSDRRVGYAETSNEARTIWATGIDVLLTDVLQDLPRRHEVESNLEVLRKIGGSIDDDSLELWLPESDIESARELIKCCRHSCDGPVVGIGIGAGDPKRIWSPERYAALSDWLVTEYQSTVVLVGDSSERRLSRRICLLGIENIHNLVGQTSLTECAAVLAKCDCFVGNDSGPMHLAAAAGVPVVAVSVHPVGGDPLSVNSSVRFSPWGVKSRLLRPVESQSLQEIGVKEVKEAIIAMNGLLE